MYKHIVITTDDSELAGKAVARNPRGSATLHCKITASLMTKEGTRLEKLVASGALVIAIIAAGTAKAAPASTIRRLETSREIVSVVRERDLCSGKGIGTRACSTCCRKHGLSASRCLRNCRND